MAASLRVTSAKPAASTSAMSAMSTTASRGKTPLVFRQCTCGGTCDSCKRRCKGDACRVSRQAIPSVRDAAAELPVSQPGDPWEREADRAADAALRGDAPLREVAATNAVAGQGGRGLPAEIRSFFEPRFGHDFSRVRIHDDAASAASARALEAAAYTVGGDIYFGAGQFAPATQAGRRLLAHELAHVVQQSDRPALRRMIHRAVVPGCKATDVCVPPSEYGPGWIATPDPRPDRPGGTVAYRVDTLYLPRLKGGNDALKMYRARAGAKRQLYAVIGPGEKDLAAELKQERDDSKGLRVEWLRGRGLNSTVEAAEAWAAVTGDEPIASFPTGLEAGKSKCDIDHIVELQLHGSNYAENLRALDAEANQEAGRTIWNQISAIAKAVLDEEKPARHVMLSFESVELFGPTNVADGPCLLADRQLERGLVKPKGTRSYEFDVGVLKATLFLEPGKANHTLAASTDNRAASELVPGMILQELHEARQSGRPADKIDGCIEPADGCRKSGDGPAGKTKTPATIAKREVKFAIKERKGKRSLAFEGTPPKGVPFHYPYLSEGKLDYAFAPDGGFTATGSLVPSLPLLARSLLTVQLANDQFKAKVSTQPIGAVRGIPGLSITSASLGFELAPEFVASGELGFALTKILTGSITASADARGFVATGALKAHLPGCDQADGTVEYASGVLSGKATIRTEQLKLPGNPRGSLEVSFVNGDIEAEGAVTVDLASLGHATLGVRRRGESFEFFGDGAVQVPGIAKPVGVTAIYDGKTLRASGKVSIEVAGLRTDDLTIDYVDGRISGHGTLALKRGKATGTLDVKLSEQGKLSGAGTITYPLFKGMQGTIGVVLPEEGELRVTGALAFPDYELVKKLAAARSLKGPHLSFPLFAIPLGVTNIGLVATIDSGIDLDFAIGPGLLRKTKIEAAFDPLAANADAAFDASTQLYVPLSAGVSFSVRGGIGLEAAIASVTGGITVRGGVRVSGETEANLGLRYRRGEMELAADLALQFKPVISLELEANIVAMAGALGVTVEERWAWQLARYVWDSGLEFAVKAAMTYSTARGLKMPGPDQITVIVPAVDAAALVRSLLANAATDRPAKK